MINDKCLDVAFFALLFLFNKLRPVFQMKCCLIKDRKEETHKANGPLFKTLFHGIEKKGSFFKRIWIEKRVH